MVLRVVVGQAGHGDPPLVPPVHPDGPAEPGEVGGGHQDDHEVHGEVVLEVRLGEDELKVDGGQLGGEPRGEGGQVAGAARGDLPDKKVKLS